MLNKGIEFDGIGDNGQIHYFAFVKDKDVVEKVERFSTQGYNRTESDKQANKYYKRFDIIK